MSCLATVHGGHGMHKLHISPRTPEVRLLSAPVREFTESFTPVDPVLTQAMAWGHELGARPVAGAVGAALRLLAAATAARAIVEVGTGTGASGLWLLGGARPDATLTTIDIEPEVQRIARQAYAAAGHAPGRARIIAGDA